MSLVDQSMTPFQQAYPMIVFLIFPILAGNTAFVSVVSSSFFYVTAHIYHLAYFVCHYSFRSFSIWLINDMTYYL